MENSHSDGNLTRSLSCNSIEEEEEDEVAEHSSEEDEPPPLPPPRLDSLQPRNPSSAAALVDRPLPNIPNSASLNDFKSCSYADGNPAPPSRPLPGVPGQDDEEEDLVEEEDADNDVRK